MLRPEPIGRDISPIFKFNNALVFLVYNSRLISNMSSAYQPKTRLVVDLDSEQDQN
jgi:hypothetical protein